MFRKIVENAPDSGSGVTILAGGAVSPDQLARARAVAPVVVAADSGADRALALGVEPAAVIGDMDSISAAARERLADRLHPVAEQETTDFEKCLQRIAAPFAVALGVTGDRADHGLAAFSLLARWRDYPVLALAGEDVIFAAPPRLALELPPETRLSLFPMAPVTGRATGLEWPIEQIAFAPAGRIGTSNRTTGPRVELEFDAPGMLVILPAAHMKAALAALV